MSRRSVLIEKKINQYMNKHKCTRTEALAAVTRPGKYPKK